jgi:hypothetical protein
MNLTINTLYLCLAAPNSLKRNEQVSPPRPHQLAQHQTPVTERARARHRDRVLVPAFLFAHVP